MSPQGNIGLWQWALGLWAGLLTFMIGLNYHRINSVKEDNKPLSCPIGQGLRKDVEALKRQAPSGEAPCAAAEDVKEIKKHITKLFEGQTKMVGLVSKMAGKMGVKE